MANYALIIIFIIFAAIATISLGFPTIVITRDDFNPDNLTQREKHELFKINQAASSNFKCSPRPRSFHSAGLFKDGNDASTMILPHIYVLHRCDNQSGCCTGPQQVCQESETKNVILMFQFYNNLTKKREYKSQIVSNHTQCECARKW